MSKVPLIIGGGVVLALLAGYALFSGAAGNARLDRSALGVEGLARLAPDLGLNVERPRRVAMQKASDLSLAVLPLYDLDLYEEDRAPQSRQEQLGQTTLREMNSYDLRDKIYEIETLVVLPKWRGGVIVTGVANRVFLIKPTEQATLLEQLYLYQSKLQHLTDGFSEEAVGIGGADHRVALFQPQTFQRDSLPDHCTELAGLAEGALLITCTRTDEMPTISYLSDPDLLNTHGITLGQNAAFIAAAVKALQDKDEARPIYLDTSTEVLLAPEADEEAQYYDRSGEDLLRFFDWPLSLLWLAGVAVFAVAIWRGSLRFGPVRVVPEDRLEISKLAAIDAKARLIRMSRNDGRMVAEFVQTRLQALADQTFGPGLGEAGVARLHAKFARANPADAAALREHATAMMAEGATPSSPDLRRNLTRFKELLERLTHGAS